ncbi:MAG: response regulator transcription factor [Drouetiella hepatica Uher 2000/2452]|jgi:DNA-binding NarL/FixJ family response regulator|uniref:Response regulator transcription factor n=1 Tax=Drouetiella hepatica Uher 2000/2452 TaxID=904376 RepID=A0A951QB95_9CYAN|nr:response regulator transcription factor [Drouetiella hepatica Uher 2000/2452]
MPLTILVADDDLGTRLAISDYLEFSGYWVVTAEDGRRALEMIEQCKPHLIVTDITMPGMDGYELMRQVRLQTAFRLLPVIFLTARTSTDERIRGYQLGCDLYLPKPFELEELGAVIRNLLERSQLIQAEWRSHLKPAPISAGITDGEAIPQVPRSSVLPKIGLTQREQEALTLLAEGLSNAQIGDRLHLSSRTVEKYVSSLFRKTGTNNRAELVRFAMDHHLII